MRLDWSFGDSRRELILIIFVATAMSMSRKVIFGCNASLEDLFYGPVLLEEALALSTLTEQRDVLTFEFPTQHCKDPPSSWGTHEELSRKCWDIVASLVPEDELPVPSVSSDFAQLINWHPLVEGITLVEIFVGIHTGLVVVLEILPLLHNAAIDRANIWWFSLG